MNKIKKIRSGGQSGVDRAALDIARKNGIDICGWCPKGGWAEDFTVPPGVLNQYPELKETPLSRVEQRTVWNVRDSDATLIINPKKSNVSAGTDLTERAAKGMKKPYLEVTNTEDIDSIITWIRGLKDNIVLNIGGPRESECIGVYDDTMILLDKLLHTVNS